MILGSVMLVLAAGVLLGLGLVFLDEPLLYSSIGVSGQAALTLVVGVRRLAAVPAGQGAIAVRPGGAALHVVTAPVRSVGPEPVRSGTATGRAAPRPVGRATPRPVGRAAVASRPPAGDADGGPGIGQADGVAAGIDVGLADADPTVPVDEPAEQPLGEADAARIAALDVEVVVIDGRPRYHLADCLHLLGLESETLPVSEAVELGFTPCGLCQPGTAALRAAGGG
jgi:hypothetical protein